MITPEYVDHLIGEVKRLRLPVASAVLHKKKITERTIEYSWVVSECPCCGEEHSHHAGYYPEEVHTYLGKHWCAKTNMYYIVMRDYDVRRDADKINPYAGMDTVIWEGKTYPIANVRLIKTQKTDGTLDLQWEVASCPFCKEKHHHPAGTILKDANKTLNLRISRCTYGGKNYVLQKEKSRRGKGS